MTIQMHEIKAVVRKFWDTLDKKHALRTFIVVTLACTSSYVLGKLSVTLDSRAPIDIQSALLSASVVTSDIAATSSQTSLSSKKAGQYVGSKSGKTYHLPWCSGASRIKEGNKIWFATKQDAEKAGYRPAANCKGI